MSELIENIDLQFGDYHLKVLDSSNVSLLLDYYLKNYLFFSKNIPFIPFELLNEELCSELLNSDYEEMMEFKKYHFFVFKKSDIYSTKIIADISISNIIQYPLFSGILGYNVDYDFINMGIASDAVSEFLNFSFDILKLHRVEAFTTLNNLPSQKVLLKNKFIEEGISSKYLKINQIWQDHKRFSVINPRF